jgi:hypothetical protein
VLAGKTVAEIMAGTGFSMARCVDGTLATWGIGTTGQLGNDTTLSSNVPVLANLSWLTTGERIMVVGNGASHVLVSVATAPKPVATTLAATTIIDSGAKLQGTVNANGSNTNVSFEYGLSTAYGSTIAATPASVTGTTATAISATLGGLLAGTTYHYRVVATSAASLVYGADLTFTTSTFTVLADLTTSGGALIPGFNSATTSYQRAVRHGQYHRDPACGKRHFHGEGQRHHGGLRCRQCRNQPGRGQHRHHHAGQRRHWI